MVDGYDSQCIFLSLLYGESPVLESSSTYNKEGENYPQLSVSTNRSLLESINSILILVTHSRKSR